MADILTANGHVDDSIGTREAHVGYEQRPLLFRNLGRNTFREISAQSGQVFQRRIVVAALPTRILTWMEISTLSSA
jgi:hypothetical protein